MMLVSLSRVFHTCAQMFLCLVNTNVSIFNTLTVLIYPRDNEERQITHVARFTTTTKTKKQNKQSHNER